MRLLKLGLYIIYSVKIEKWSICLRQVRYVLHILFQTSQLTTFLY